MCFGKDKHTPEKTQHLLFRKISLSIYDNLLQYLCQFMIIFFQGLFGDSINEEYQVYANMVFEKINPWGHVIQEEYVKYINNEQIVGVNNTLRLRIKFIRE